MNSKLQNRTARLEAILVMMLML